MASKLLRTLGYDDNDPDVVAGRRFTETLGRLLTTLIRAREDRKLTQTDVANVMGTTQSSISNFERLGGDPKLSTIFRYADAIGADVRLSVVFPNADWPKTVTAKSPKAGSPIRRSNSPFKVCVL